MSPGTEAFLWWRYSGEARGLYYQAFNVATDRLEAVIAKQDCDCPLAVILDIDETVLDNGPFERSLFVKNKTFDATAWADWVAKSKAAALRGAVEFLERAASHTNVNIYYISSRDSSQLKATVRNLREQNFPMADTNHVFLKRTDSNGNKVDKPQNRQRVREFVALAIGDDLNDFTDALASTDLKTRLAKVDEKRDAFGRLFILLPNPMYGHWQDALWDTKLSEIRKHEKMRDWLKGKNDGVLN